MTLTRNRPLHVMMVELVILVIILIFNFILRDIKERLLSQYSEEFKYVFNVLLLVVHVYVLLKKN